MPATPTAPRPESGPYPELHDRAAETPLVGREQAVPQRPLDDHRFTATLSGSIQPLLGQLARQRVSSMLIEEPDRDWTPGRD